MTGLMYGIAAAVVTAFLTGVGWLIRDVIRSRVEGGKLQNEKEAEKETNRRMRNDHALLKEIHEEVSSKSDAHVAEWVRNYRDKMRGGKR